MSLRAPLPKEAVLVVNAHSRKGRELFEEAAAKLRDAGVTLSAAHALRDPGRLVPTVRDAVAAGAPMVIVGGGDGSLSSAVDALVGKACVLAILPLGTANSFARTLGIPLDLDGAVATIAGGRRRRVDLGVLDGDHFANCAAMGLAPIIGATVPHGLKRWLGRLGYLVWACWSLVRFRPFRLTIEDGEGVHTVWATEVRIANGSFQGGVELIEEASVSSGRILVQVVTGRGTGRLLWDWGAKFFRLPARDAATEEFSGKRIRLDARPRQRISVDGEVTGWTPAVAEIAAGAIEVAVPSPTD
ncbi:MAG TPA: diacylglycerol kinase family protein [Allosphingosinicella sp.]|nr:diacylglycerol kinase family protein [Allosphingosinicella sp.]